MLGLDSTLDNVGYTTEPKKWYKAYPYGFAFWEFDGTGLSRSPLTFWLPIAPNNINVTTHYATNIITTLYGIIEEHSEVRYYDIVISGNTGIAPKYTTTHTPRLGYMDGPARKTFDAAWKKVRQTLNPGQPSVGRASFGSADSAGVLGGFLPEVTNTLAAAANLASSIADDLTGGPLNKTGILPEESGYFAFHNLYNFLLKYKADASKSREASIAGSKTRSKHPLQFLNHKDNIQYDCVPISFTLVRTADNPMLYQYNIKLRAFNLRNVNDGSVDNDDLLDELGLAGFQTSLFAIMTGIAGKASTLLSGIKGAL